MAYVIGNDCIACGTCIDECPVGASSEGDIYKINADACTECGSGASVAQVKQLAWVNHNKLLLIKFSGLERVRFFYSISITFILIRILNISLLH